jgi:hypothetical protein
MKLFILTVLCLVILYVQTAPINCSRGAKQLVLETEDALNEESTEILGFGRMFRKGVRAFKRVARKAVNHSKNVGKNLKKGVGKVGGAIKKGGNKLGQQIKKGGKFLGKNIVKGSLIAGKNIAKGAAIATKNFVKGVLLGVHYVKYAGNYLFKSTTKIPLSSLALKCQTTDVCVVDCSKIITGCKKPAFFANFVNNVKESKKLEVFSAYLKACIKREYDDPSEDFWMRDALVKYINEAKQFHTSAKVVVTAQLPFFEILEKIDANKEQLIPRYLKGMSELFLSFKKMCHEDPVSF